MQFTTDFRKMHSFRRSSKLSTTSPTIIIEDKCLLTCQQCKSLLKFPVILVEDFGNVCGTCAELSNKKGIRNSPFESVIKSVILSCEHKSHGCPEQLSYVEIEKHQSLCNFRPICCQLRRCTWKGSLDDFLGHFLEKHSINVIAPGGSCKFQMKLLPSSYVKFLAMFKDDSNSFFVKVDADHEDDVYFSAYHCNKHFTNEMERNVKLTGVGHRSIEFKSKILPLNRMFDRVFQLEGVTKFNGESLRNVLGELEEISIGKVDDKLILNDFERMVACPVCFHTMKGYIWQCKEGHSFCENCTSVMKRCPICRANLMDVMVRNHHLEDLVASVLEI